MLVPGGSYLGDEAEGAYDLRFGIRTRHIDMEWRVSAPDYTKETADACIPKDQREAVRGKLLQAIGILVFHAGRPDVTMETYYSNLDGNALKKYQTICDFLASLGYSTKDAFRDETNGKNYWFISRTD
jgi:hypothetical protein